MLATRPTPRSPCLSTATAAPTAITPSRSSSPHAKPRRRPRSNVRTAARPRPNASFFVDPYSPHTLDFWRAFNDHQLEIGGDPFVGAKLGNLLQAVGFRDIQTTVKTFHLDNRQPGERAEMLAYWTELLLSAAPGLEAAGKIGERTVRGMADELVQVGRDPNAVFFYSFVQARACAW